MDMIGTRQSQYAKCPNKERDLTGAFDKNLI